jgi:hypothetical protein
MVAEEPMPVELEPVKPPDESPTAPPTAVIAMLEPVRPVANPRQAVSTWRQGDAKQLSFFQPIFPGLLQAWLVVTLSRTRQKFPRRSCRSPRA